MLPVRAKPIQMAKAREGGIFFIANEKNSTFPKPKITYPSTGKIAFQGSIE